MSAREAPWHCGVQDGVQVGSEMTWDASLTHLAEHTPEAAQSTVQHTGAEMASPMWFRCCRAVGQIVLQLPAFLPAFPHLHTSRTQDEQNSCLSCAA